MKGLVVAILLAFALYPDLIASQFNGGPPKSMPRKEDVKFILCDVCKHLAAAAFEQATDMKLDELALIERMERVATAWRDEGAWMKSLYLEKKGSKLAVVEMGKEGECKEACKTIEQAADDIASSHDTDIAEALFTVIAWILAVLVLREVCLGNALLFLYPHRRYIEIASLLSLARCRGSIPRQSSKRGCALSSPHPA
jgi:hypothetical protein